MWDIEVKDQRDPFVAEILALCRSTGKSFLELTIPGFYDDGGGYDQWKKSTK